MSWPIHSGRRKRGPHAAEIEAMQKRRPGSKAERAVADRLYEPEAPLLRCETCKDASGLKVVLYAGRCPVCRA